MDRRDFITMVLIVFLSLWGTLYLETDLAEYFVLELFVILLLTIAAVGIFYGLATDKEWAWPYASMFFVAALINCICIYAASGNTTPFVITSIINFVGIGAGVSRLMNFEAEKQSKPSIPKLPPMPAYHIDESELVDHIEVENLEQESFREIETYEPEEEDIRNIPKAVQKKRKTAGKKKTAKKKPKKKKR